VLLGGDPSVATAAELDLLREAGADLRVVALARSPVFDNRDVGGVRKQWCLEPGDPLPVAALPDAWRSASDWVFGSVAGELPDEWGSVPDPAARVALGWQGLLRQLPRGGPVVRRPILARSDLVVTSRLDVDPGARIDELGPLLRGGATLVVTDGDAGGEVWRADGDQARLVRRYAAIPAAKVVDATGAGDAFLAGMVAARMGHPLGGSGRRGTDLRLAAALGSLAVEGPGVLGLPVEAAVAARLGAAVRRG